MNSLIKRLAYDAAEPIERLSAQFLKKGALCLSGLACLVVSLAFFTVALNDYVRSIAGSEIAALSIGAAYELRANTVHCHYLCVSTAAGHQQPGHQ